MIYTVNLYIEGAMQGAKTGVLENYTSFFMLIHFSV